MKFLGGLFFNIIASSLRKYVFVKKTFSRYYCQSTQNILKRREMWFLAGVRMYMFVRVYVCVRARVRACVSDFQRLKPR